MKYIGQSVPRVDAIEKVKGKAIFASDMEMPGQAYMKMLMAHRPQWRALFVIPVASLITAGALTLFQICCL